MLSCVVIDRPISSSPAGISGLSGLSELSELSGLSGLSDFFFFFDFRFPFLLPLALVEDFLVVFLILLGLLGL